MLGEAYRSYQSNGRVCFPRRGLVRVSTTAASDDAEASQRIVVVARSIAPLAAWLL